MELAGITDRVLIENNVGAIRNNAGNFARAVVDEEGRPLTSFRTVDEPPVVPEPELNCVTVTRGHTA